MRINIGPYLTWWGPYQIVDAIFFWHEKYPDDELDKRWDYRLHDRIACWLADTWVADACQWVHDRRNRRVKIKIDRYDTWSMDHTLAMIVLPMLKRLKETKNGAPWVDDEDVPEQLRSTAAPAKENDWDVDDNHFKRWDWVLDEMIWTFEQLVDNDNESQFYDHSAVDKSSSLESQIKQIKVDLDGMRAHNERIQRGTILFGKYFRNLGD